MNPLGLEEEFRIPLTGIGSGADEASSEASVNMLRSPIPNPVRKTFTLTVAVNRGQRVTVEVHDALDRRVQTLYDGALAAASETLTFDASMFSVDVYIVRTTGEDFAETRRVTAIR